MPLKKTRKEVQEAQAPIPPALKEELEALHDKLEAAGCRRQVLDHLQEAYFQMDPSVAEQPVGRNTGL